MTLIMVVVRYMCTALGLSDGDWFNLDNFVTTILFWQDYPQNYCFINSEKCFWSYFWVLNLSICDRKAQ